MPQIVVENLCKSYRVAVRKPGMWGAIRGVASREHRVVQALDSVSFEIDEGELVGYIGPNGAGKSTTVKALAGILVPDSGTCIVRGRTPWRERRAHVAEIGVVFGQRTQLWWDLPVRESFELLGEMYRVPKDRLRRTLTELVDVLQIASVLDQPVRQLSLGQRMRCDLAASLLHTPPILFLDEPTIGLDAISKPAIREFVRRQNREEGVTVILTTHDLDDIESLCSRVMLIASGKMLSDGPVSALREAVGGERRLTLDLEDTHTEVTHAAARLVSRDGARVVLAFRPAEVSTAELIRSITDKHAIKDLTVEEAPIEEIVAGIYREIEGA